jgi:sugar O-acyltransferase (sialic acid O-acetyltransferase NeuD family)
MIIAGAGSAGIETLGIYLSSGKTDIVLYDDKSNTNVEFLRQQYKIINTEEDLRAEISRNPKFCVAVGNPRMRGKLFERLVAIGGYPTNIMNTNLFYSISDLPQNGTIIQPGVNISYGLGIGKSCMIHANSTIGHKVKIGNFVNIGPLCSIIGPCEIGDYTYIGARCILLPNFKIGRNVIIPAGSIVNRDISDFETFG